MRCGGKSNTIKVKRVKSTLPLTPPGLKFERCAPALFLAAEVSSIRFTKQPMTKLILVVPLLQLDLTNSEGERVAEAAGKQFGLRLS